jgi:hypothetical protein
VGKEIKGTYNSQPGEPEMIINKYEASTISILHVFDFSIGFGAA